jgi:hypothetical protein
MILVPAKGMDLITLLAPFFLLTRVPRRVGFLPCDAIHGHRLRVDTSTGRLGCDFGWFLFLLCTGG